MLVVIRGLENWRHLLEDTKLKFKVQIDYKNLKYFMKAQNLNRKQACQALYLSRFDFTLKHVPETKIEKADRLSRRLDWKVEVKNNNNNQTLIKKQQICSLSKVVIEGPEVEILEKIKITRSKDKEVIRVVEEIKKIRVKVLRENKWQIEGELVLKKEKVYMLKDEVLRIKIIQLHHDIPVAGYRGRWKTIELVMRNYQWLGVTKDIK